MSASFAVNISNFQRFGTYAYKFDNVGNMIFNSSSTDFSQVYLAFPLQNVFYDNTKIQTFYDPEFTEFQMTPESATETASSLQTQLDAIQSENTALKSQLDSIITSQIVSDASGSVEITKRLILELRKALGEGQIDDDFSTVFPYLPLTLTTSTTS